MKCSLSTKEIIDNQLYDYLYNDDIIGFISLINQQKNIASKNTHYDHLNKWSDVIYEYIRTMLKKYNFKNGEDNSSNKDVFIWWKIYHLMSNIIYSPYLVTSVSPHHSSAFERNNALNDEINLIYEYFSNKSNLSEKGI